MTDKTEPKDPLRYRAYYWLMHICALGAGVGLLNWLTYPYQPTYPVAYYWALQYFLLVTNGILPVVLIISRFMRDDYAEALWKRSVVIVGCIAAITPPIIVLLPSAVEAVLVPLNITVPDFWQAYRSLIYDEELGRWGVIYRAWLSFNLIFVGVFQWLRWRDAR